MDQNELINHCSSCDLYVMYTNEPDYTLHRTDYSDTAKVQEIFNKAEKNIALIKSSLGMLFLKFTWLFMKSCVVDFFKTFKILHEIRDNIK